MCYIDERHYVGCGHLHDKILIANCDPRKPERNRPHHTSCRVGEAVTIVPLIGPQFCAQCMPAKIAEVRTVYEQEMNWLVGKELWKGCHGNAEIEKYRQDLKQEVEGHVQRLFEPDQEMLQLG